MKHDRRKRKTDTERERERELPCDEEGERERERFSEKVEGLGRGWPKASPVATSGYGFCF